MSRLLPLLLIACLLGCARGPKVGGPPVLEFRAVQAPELPLQTLAAVTPQNGWILLAANAESLSLRVSGSSDGLSWSAPDEVATNLPSGPYTPYEVQLLRLPERLLFLCAFTSKEDLDVAFRTKGDAIPYLRSASSDDGKEWTAQGSVALKGIPGVQLLEDASSYNEHVAAVGRASIKRFPLYRSHDGGQSWLATELELMRPPKSLELEITSPDPNSPPDLTVDQQGRVHLTLPYQGGSLYLRSADGVRPDLVEFLEGGVPARGVATGYNPSGELYRVRALIQSSGCHLVLEISRDDGLSWTAPATLHRSSSEMSRLDVQGEGNLLVASWQEGVGLFCCVSKDGGQSWSAAQQVAPIQGRYSLVIHEGVVLIAGHDESMKLHVMVAK